MSQQAFILAQFASQEATQLYVMSGILEALSILLELSLHKHLVHLLIRLETVDMLLKLKT